LSVFPLFPVHIQKKQLETPESYVVTQGLIKNRRAGLIVGADPRRLKHGVISLLEELDLEIKGSEKSNPISDQIEVNTGQITRLSYSIWIDQGCLELDLMPDKGIARISGVVLECVELMEQQP